MIYRLKAALIKCGALILGLSVMLAAASVPHSRALADEPEEGRVLKVVFSEVPGFTETDEDGTRHGIVVDYLNEIVWIA